MRWTTGLAPFADRYNLTVVLPPHLLRQFHRSSLAGTEWAAGTLFGSRGQRRAGQPLETAAGVPLQSVAVRWVALLPAGATSFILLLAKRILLGVPMGAESFV